MQSIQKVESFGMGWVWINFLILINPLPRSRIGLSDVFPGWVWGFLSFLWKLIHGYQLGRRNQWILIGFNCSKIRIMRALAQQCVLAATFNLRGKSGALWCLGRQDCERGTSGLSGSFSLVRESFCKGQTIRSPSTKWSLKFSPAPHLSPQVTKKVQN